MNGLCSFLSDKAESAVILSLPSSPSQPSQFCVWRTTTTTSQAPVSHLPHSRSTAAGAQSAPWHISILYPLFLWLLDARNALMHSLVLQDLYCFQRLQDQRNADSRLFLWEWYVKERSEKETWPTSNMYAAISHTALEDYLSFYI